MQTGEEEFKKTIRVGMVATPKTIKCVTIIMFKIFASLNREIFIKTTTTCSKSRCLENPLSTTAVQLVDIKWHPKIDFEFDYAFSRQTARVFAFCISYISILLSCEKE